MADHDWLEIIKQYPIDDVIADVRARFGSICSGMGLPPPEALPQCTLQEYRELFDSLINGLLCHPAAGLLPSKFNQSACLRDSIKRVSQAITVYFDPDTLDPLMNEVLLASDPDGCFVWGQVDRLHPEPPPPASTEHASSSSSSSLFLHTSGFPDASAHDKYVRDMIKKQLNYHLHVGVPCFHGAILGSVGVERIARAVFRDCLRGGSPPGATFRHHHGWDTWPGAEPSKGAIVSWLADIAEKLVAQAERYFPTPVPGGRREFFVVDETTVALVDHSASFPGFGRATGARRRYSHMLVPGETSTRASDDKALGAWVELGKTAKCIFHAQPSRRFVLGFTLCGPRMRVWLVDRLGAIASQPFDINQFGLRFVTTILSFARMADERLGFDPTFVASPVDGKTYVEIVRNGARERLVIDRLLFRARSVAGRATTCWMAHRVGDPTGTPMVVKDSWHEPESEEEGRLLREVSERDVANVVRYYHHSTVQVGDADDDVLGNVRSGLDAARATHWPAARGGRGGGGRRRDRNAGVENRVRRRLILLDFGEPIYGARSCKALVGAFARCVQGHESLYHAGFLHRDVSINNLIINENPEWPAPLGFLIDMDLAVDRSQRAGGMWPVGTSPVGTKPYLALRLHAGEARHHSFMHDLESFFWVLIAVCTQYDGPCERVICPDAFSHWGQKTHAELLALKRELIFTESVFLLFAEESFTPFYQPLIKCAGKLRNLLFPWGGARVREDLGLYGKMVKVLEEAYEEQK